MICNFTGKTFSVRKFVEMSFKEVGLRLDGKERIKEIGLNKQNGKILVK